jgi:hypothetical protein
MHSDLEECLSENRSENPPSHSPLISLRVAKRRQCIRKRLTFEKPKDGKL